MPVSNHIEPRCEGETHPSEGTHFVTTLERSPSSEYDPSSHYCFISVSFTRAHLFFFSQCRVSPVILVSSTMTSGKSTRQKQWLFLFWLHNGMAELSSCHNTTFNFCGKNTVQWPGIVVSCFCFCFFLLQLLHCAIGDDLRMTI